MREEKTEPTEVFSGEILDEGLKRTKKVLKKKNRKRLKYSVKLFFGTKKHNLPNR